MQEHPDIIPFDPKPDIEDCRKYERTYREIELISDEDLYGQKRNQDEEQMMVLDESIQLAKKLKKYMKNGKNYPKIPSN